MITEDIKLPPQNLDAERALLGSLLLMNEAMDFVNITPEHFYAVQNSVVFSAMFRLWKSGCRAIDLVVLCEELARAGELQDAGGLAVVADLIDLCPHGAHHQHYAGIVERKASQRSVIEAARRAMESAYLDEEPAEIAAALTKQIEKAADRGATEFGTIRQALSELRSIQQNPVSRKTTGLTNLDSKLGGGIGGCQSIIIAGRPGSGKSVLGGQIVRAFAERGEPALIVSLEMGSWELAERFERCSGEDLEELPIYFDESSQRADAIIRSIRRAKRRHGISVCFLDYLQLVESDQKNSSRERQVAEVSRAVKLLCRELNIPIISGCQLNRDSQRENRKPRLGDLRESGAIEQDADIVLLLHEGEEGQDEIIVGKHRGGECGSVPVMFQKARSRFVCRDLRSEPWTGAL